jgi:hypothetical protein
MAHFDSQNLTEQDLAGRWVAVDQHAQGKGQGYGQPTVRGLSHLPSGAVLVDYDTELDLLCQRVAAKGLKRLTIFKYEASADGYRRTRGAA